MEEVSHAEELERLQQQIDDLTTAEAERAQAEKAAEESRVKAQQAQAEQIQQQLQSVTGAAIGTMGSIEQAKAVLSDQTRERHQLEGMLRATMNQR